MKQFLIGAILALPLCAQAHNMCPSGEEVTETLLAQHHDFAHGGHLDSFRHGVWDYDTDIYPNYDHGQFTFHSAFYTTAPGYGDAPNILSCKYKHPNPEYSPDVVNVSREGLHHCDLAGHWVDLHEAGDDHVIRACGDMNHSEVREHCQFTCE